MNERSQWQHMLVHEHADGGAWAYGAHPAPWQVALDEPLDAFQKRIEPFGWLRRCQIKRSIHVDGDRQQQPVLPADPEAQHRARMQLARARAASRQGGTWILFERELRVDAAGDPVHDPDEERDARRYAVPVATQVIEVEHTEDGVAVRGVDREPWEVTCEGPMLAVLDALGRSGWRLGEQVRDSTRVTSPTLKRAHENRFPDYVFMIRPCPKGTNPPTRPTAETLSPPPAPAPSAPSTTASTEDAAPGREVVTLIGTDRRSRVVYHEPVSWTINIDQPLRATLDRWGAEGWKLTGMRIVKARPRVGATAPRATDNALRTTEVTCEVRMQRVWPAWLQGAPSRPLAPPRRRTPHHMRPKHIPPPWIPGRRWAFMLITQDDRGAWIEQGGRAASETPSSEPVSALLAAALAKGWAVCGTAHHHGSIEAEAGHRTPIRVIQHILQRGHPAGPMDRGANRAEGVRR